MNAYAEILKDNLPKLLNLYNLDPLAKTNGFGDRLYWGWKVRDFSNATLQGGVHSLAIALDLGLIKEENFILDLIDKAILAVNKIKDPSNSVVEAYPNEQSFCVTALVAFDVLSAIDILGDRLHSSKKEKYLSVIAPLIEFIEENDEEHAVISNHLATGVAAIAIWNKYANKKSNRHTELLNIIYSHQSSEGWYKEYEGADPGYQTLCTYYLAVANLYLKSDALQRSLEQSLEFLKYFVHPDGSIGGLYGSRNTEVFYPGGIAILAEHSDLARSILQGLESGLANGVHILPQIIDIGNYIPLLNAYACASRVEVPEDSSDQQPLPFQKEFQKSYTDSGMFIHSTSKYYAILNFKKGGTVKVFDKENRKLDLEDGGWICKNSNGDWVSTQQMDAEVSFENHDIEASFYKNNEAYPSPFQFMILRFLSLTIFKSNRLGNIFKRLVVKMLMTGKNKVDGSVKRRFVFEEKGIQVIEKLRAPAAYPNGQHGGKFKSIHMASSGYNTRQLLNAAQRPNFVTFQTEYED